MALGSLLKENLINITEKPYAIVIPFGELSETNFKVNRTNDNLNKLLTIEEYCKKNNQKKTPPLIILFAEEQKKEIDNYLIYCPYLQTNIFDKKIELLFIKNLLYDYRTITRSIENHIISFKNQDTLATTTLFQLITISQENIKNYYCDILLKTIIDYIIDSNIINRKRIIEIIDMADILYDKTFTLPLSKNFYFNNNISTDVKNYLIILKTHNNWHNEKFKSILEAPSLTSLSILLLKNDKSL